MGRDVYLDDLVLIELDTLVNIAKPHGIEPYPLWRATVEPNPSDTNRLIVFR
jgi:hypothetical protein